MQLDRRDDLVRVSTGFVLGQEDIQNLPGFEEAFDVAATQIRIADLEQRTGLELGNIKNFDHFAVGGAPGTLEFAKRHRGGGSPRENSSDTAAISSSEETSAARSAKGGSMGA